MSPAGVRSADSSDGRAKDCKYFGRLLNSGSAEDIFLEVF